MTHDADALWIGVAAMLMFSCAAAEKVVPHAAPWPAPAYGSVSAAFAALPGPGEDSRIVYLSDNSESWAMRWQLVHDAAQVVEADYFLVEADTFGLAFLGLLLDRAHAGLTVRLIVDGRGSIALTTPGLGREYLQELAAEPTATVGVYNPVPARLLESLAALDALPVASSTHQKLLLIDRRVAVVGGRNIADPYFADRRDVPFVWHDAELVIRGERALLQLGSLFATELRGPGAGNVRADLLTLRPRADEMLLFAYAMDAWLRADPSSPSADALRADADLRQDASLRLEAAAFLRLGRDVSRGVRLAARTRIAQLTHHIGVRGSLFHAPAHDEHVAPLKIIAKPSRIERRVNTATPGIHALLRSAQREVHIDTPSFTLTPPLLRAFEELGARGVPIVVVTNGPTVSDNAVAQAMFVEEWPEILARVPTLRLFAVARRSPIHTKRFTIDGEVLLLGTYNIDPMSEAMNSEVMAVMWSPELVAASADADLTAVARGDLVEYRIVRDAAGRPVRDADGRVQVAFGPQHHTPEAKLRSLRTLKGQLLAIEGLFGLEPVVW